MKFLTKVLHNACSRAKKAVLRLIKLEYLGTKCRMVIEHGNGAQLFADQLD
jgi:hypothetical protein